MHLHSDTPAAAVAPLRIAVAPAADTFCPREYRDLCDTVAATHLGGPIEPTVQSAVAAGYLTRGEKWVAEAHVFLSEYNQPTMSAAR